MDLLAPHLRNIVRTDSADLRGDFVRLDRNDRAVPVSEDDYCTLLPYLTRKALCQYPDPKPLQERLAQIEGLPAGHALVTNGSDAAIRRLFHAALVPGDRVVIPHPTYEMYRVYTDIFQAKPVLVEYSDSLDIDVDALCRTIVASQAKIVSLVNPDQPTGHLFAPEEVERVVATAANVGTLVIVDEAYFLPGRPSATSLVQRFSNLAVTRSHSKYFGLGGIRLGCLYGAPPVIDMAVRVKGLHEVNGIALAIGEALADHPSIVANYISELEEGRRILCAFARERGFRTPDCPTTFQLVSVGNNYRPQEIVMRLKEKGFLIKGTFAHSALKSMLRISLAGPVVMQPFVQAFDEVLEATPAVHA